MIRQTLFRKPEDQWSCKRSPETRDMYQPATNQNKGLGQKSHKM